MQPPQERSTDSSQLELQPRDGHGWDDPSRAASSYSLKRADGGREAWTVLISGFIFEALFWGFPMCFGVFQKYYTQIPEFKPDESNIPLIGTVAQSLYYLGGPLSALATKRFPKYQRQQIWAGWPLSIFGLLFASFCSSVDGLIATQGFLYGVGFATVSYPIVSMVNEWWVARKGMAFGLISASSGFTGAVMPFIIEALLARYGHKTTLRACAVAMAVLTFPLLFFLRGRLPVPENSTLARSNWSFFRIPLFWVYTSAILIHGMGFFFPSVFLPSFASSLDLSSVNGALLLALMSISQVLGQFALGYLSDKNLSVSLLAAVCCVIAAVSSLTLWGLGKSMALLVPFSIIYGFFSFGFTTLRVAMGRAVSDDPSTVVSMFAFFVFLQGVGNILVGPISAALMKAPTVMERFGTGKYEGVIILTGTSSAVAASVIALWHAGKRVV